MTSETRGEQIRNLELRAWSVENANAFRREGESKEDALQSILKAAERLTNGYA